MGFLPLHKVPTYSQPSKDRTMPGIPTVPRIHPMSSPNYPQFAFEWHEASQKVYLLPIPGKWELREYGSATPPTGSIKVTDSRYSTKVYTFLPGEQRHIEAKCIAEHCENHGKFIGFVQTWLRGYALGLIHHREGIVP